MIFAILQNRTGVWGFHHQADLYGIWAYKISACDLLRRSFLPYIYLSQECGFQKAQKKELRRKCQKQNCHELM